MIGRLESLQEKRAGGSTPNIKYIKFVGNANHNVYAGHRGILRASELVPWTFQYHIYEQLKKGLSQMMTPVVLIVSYTRL